FFLLVTGTPQTNQATSNEVQHIYTYFGGKENEFRARTSTLYVGVQEMTNATTTTFFDQIETMEKLEKGYLGDHIVDVIVVQNNEPHRYQVSNGSIYDVDHAIFYKGEGALYEEAFNVLYDFKINSYYLIFPLGIISINLIEKAYYKRKKIKEENILEKSWVLMAIVVAGLVSIFAYSSFIGPLYKPFLLVLAILYGYTLWKVVQRQAKLYVNLKVESYKAISLTILLMIFILTL
ncbi:MAG: hypothetical protein RR588_15240, partial [Solibacillus sp.]